MNFSQTSDGSLSTSSPLPASPRAKRAHTHTHPQGHRALLPSVRPHSGSGRPHLQTQTPGALTTTKAGFLCSQSPAGHTQPQMCWLLRSEKRLPREGASSGSHAFKPSSASSQEPQGGFPPNPAACDELPHQASVHTSHLERIQRPAETQLRSATRKCTPSLAQS